MVVGVAGDVSFENRTLVNTEEISVNQCSSVSQFIHGGAPWRMKSPMKIKSGTQSYTESHGKKREKSVQSFGKLNCVELLRTGSVKSCTSSIIARWY